MYLDVGSLDNKKFKPLTSRKNTILRNFQRKYQFASRVMGSCFTSVDPELKALEQCLSVTSNGALS